MHQDAHIPVIKTLHDYWLLHNKIETHEVNSWCPSIHCATNYHRTQYTEMAIVYPVIYNSQYTVIDFSHTSLALLELENDCPQGIDQ